MPTIIEITAALYEEIKVTPSADSQLLEVNDSVMVDGDSGQSSSTLTAQPKVRKPSQFQCQGTTKSGKPCGKGISKARKIHNGNLATTILCNTHVSQIGHFKFCAGKDTESVTCTTLIKRQPPYHQYCGVHASQAVTAGVSRLWNLPEEIKRLIIAILTPVARVAFALCSKDCLDLVQRSQPTHRRPPSVHAHWPIVFRIAKRSGSNSSRPLRIAGEVPMQDHYFESRSHGRWEGAVHEILSMPVRHSPWLFPLAFSKCKQCHTQLESKDCKYWTRAVVANSAWLKDMPHKVKELNPTTPLCRACLPKFKIHAQCCSVCFARNPFTTVARAIKVSLPQSKAAYDF